MDEFDSPTPNPGDDMMYDMFMLDQMEEQGRTQQEDNVNDNETKKPLLARMFSPDAMEQAGRETPRREIPKENPLWRLRYNITKDEDIRAFHAFQRKYVYRKNWIYTAAFAVVSALYVAELIRNPDYTMGYALLGVCLAVIFFVWYNPIKVRKNLLKGMDQITDDSYVCDIFEEVAVVKTILKQEQQEQEGEQAPAIEPSVIHYASDQVELMELEDLLVLLLRKQMFYVLPKRAMTAQEQDEIKEFFKRKL